MYSGTRLRHNVIQLSTFLLPFLSAALATTAGMGGDKLRCCAAVEKPILEENKAAYQGFEGLAIDYLRKLESRLNFTCSSLKLFSNEDNVHFNAVVNHLHGCTTPSGDSPVCQCDMAVGGWFQNPERFGLVDFLPPFVPDGMSVIVHRDNTSSSSAGAFFITAFSVPVWIFIMVLVFVFTFLKILDSRFVRGDTDTYRPLPESASCFLRVKHFLLKSRILYRLRKAFQSTLNRMVGQGGSDPVEGKSTFRQWVLNLLIGLCSLFLILAYESAMTAQLVQDTLVSDYRNIDDLRKCHIPTEQVCVPIGGGIELLWNHTIASDPCHKGKSPIGVPSYEIGAMKLYRKECKFMVSSIATAISQSEGLSFLLPLGSKYIEMMSNATLDMQRSGELQFAENYVKSHTQCPKNNHLSLTLKKLQLFFILAFVGCFVIFMEMVFDPQGKNTARTTEQPEFSNDDETHPGHSQKSVDSSIESDESV